MNGKYGDSAYSLRSTGDHFSLSSQQHPNEERGGAFSVHPEAPLQGKEATKCMDCQGSSIEHDPPDQTEMCGLPSRR